MPLSVAMVNDCAWVGETLIKYFPGGVRFTRIKRARDPWSKTLGLALGILRARADVYHVHYGLQDHLLVKLLKRGPTLCHFHGSDLRRTLRTRWGWMVKVNLETADRVVVGVPDVLPIARRYRGDATYVPNPVDLGLFSPAPARRASGVVVLLASDLSLAKGVDRFVRAFARFQETHPDSLLRTIDRGPDRPYVLRLLRRLGVRYEAVPAQPRERMPQLYRDSDIVATDFALGYLHMTSLEAMACRRPVVQYVNPRYYGRELPPVARARTVGEIVDALDGLVDERWREEVAAKQRAYVVKHHDPVAIAKRVAAIYEELLK